MKRGWKPLTEEYLGEPLGQNQCVGGVRGAVSGGSKPTPQAHIPGKVSIGSSAPKRAQKLRG